MRPCPPACALSSAPTDSSMIAPMHIAGGAYKGVYAGGYMGIWMGDISYAYMHGYIPIHISYCIYSYAHIIGLILCISHSYMHWYILSHALRMQSE